MPCYRVFIAFRSVDATCLRFFILDAEITYGYAITQRSCFGEVGGLYPFVHYVVSFIFRNVSIASNSIVLRYMINSSSFPRNLQDNLYLRT
jgi:hypothetical protein